MADAPYRLGFTTLTSEIDVPALPVSGQVPEWLRGRLLRTGPARFEIGDARYSHWFDGLAMLHGFRFADGRIGYANRYLRGQSYTAATREHAIRRGEFATNPQRGWLARALPFMRRELGDNGNVNTSRIGDSLVALTETPTPVRFDPATLETLGGYRYRGDLRGQVTTAHPQFDAHRNRQYNYLLEFGRISRYHLYGIGADERLQRIASIPVERPAYMHSFGMSERYLILTEFPLVVNPLKLLLGSRPFIQNYRWQPARGTRFHVVDKDTGAVVKTARSDAFFAFHHVNAFERGGELVVDLVAFPDASVIDQLYLDRLRSAQPVTAAGRLTRCRIPLTGGDRVQLETLADTPLELPRFDYRARAMRPYRYVYGAGASSGGGFLDRLVKLDIETGAVATWQETGCYPGEPVFVAAPRAGAEDAGVLLSVVLDARAGTSFLLVLDAASFTERARARVPHHIPFGFHGNFFGAA